MQHSAVASAPAMELLPLAVLPEIDANLGKCLTMFASQSAFTVSSCRTPDMPIVYASPHFCSMTGYTAKEVLGRNCRFLQGPGTSRQSVLEIRDSIQEDRGCTVCILNYTKQKKPFWNQLCLSPISDQHGVAYYLGIQTNVTGAVLAYRTQIYSPFHITPAGPHGGVHSFEGCSDIVAREVQMAKQLGSKIQRWHSEKLLGSKASNTDYRPISSALLPASLLGPLYKLQQSFCLADPNLPDMPIVHASEGFLRLTGRPRSEVVGHNCRFMQGPGTDQSELERLRAAVSEERPVTVSLINYRHDGSAFWNHLHVAPIRNADGKVVFFVGVQLDITKEAPTVKVKQAQTEAAPEGTSQNLPTSTEVLAQLSLAEPKSSCLESTGAVATQTSLREGQGTSNLGPTKEEQLQPVEAPANGHSSDLGSRKIVGPQEKQLQRSVVGTVRVVCRSLSAKSGLRRSFNDQHRPHADDLNILKEAETVSAPSRLDIPTLGSSHI